jgi:hypothetical protein
MTLNYVCCAFLIFCVAASGAGPTKARLPSAPLSIQLTAVVLPDGQYSQVAVSEMGREAAHILKQSGLSLRWRVGTPAQSVSGLLVVVKLRGRCDMDGSASFLVPGPLGWSDAVNGTILPFSDLACDNIRGAVQSAISDGSVVRGNVLLGRAMGRVLAHELYHIVADTSEHSSGGVTQATLTPRQLTSGELPMQRAETEAVASALSRGR